MLRFVSWFCATHASIPLLSAGHYAATASVVALLWMLCEASAPKKEDAPVQKNPMVRCGTYAGQSLYFIQTPFQMNGMEHKTGYHYWTGTKYRFLGDTESAVLDKAFLEGVRVVFHTTSEQVASAPGNPARVEHDSGGMGEPLSRFRPKYRALHESEKALHDAIKDKAAELEALYEQVLMVRRAATPSGVGSDPRVNPNSRLPAPVPPRYLALATTELESSVMWAVKALTAPVQE